MPVTLSGEGEHLWLQVRKIGANTDWVATQLARAAGVAARDVSYAGLKDRHAVTTQWFSVQLPGKADPAWQGLPDEISILQQQRHNKKLRRGALSANHFTLTLRDCQGDWAAAEAVCAQIRAQGLPNYYGEQRFGHDFGNIHKAQAWFAGQFKPKQRHQRSLYLSAARSYLFNAILAERVRQATWQQRVPGDVFMFADGASWFTDDASEGLDDRLAAQAIHPTGALWGRGDVPTQDVARQLELEQVAPFTDLCTGLEQHGLKQERRALRVNVPDLSLRPLATEQGKADLQLQFTLPPGAYATVLLAQLGNFSSEPNT